MHLSKRLQAIYNLVNSPCILADIGCDHALLPIALLQDGKCQKAYACDVHTGPLNRAKEAVQLYHMEAQIETILSDGLTNVPDDVSVIVIAGMGWESIVSILEAGEEQAKKCSQLILQSNNHVDDLRRWLSTHGYVIDQEDIVKERHYYQILSIHPQQQALSEDEILFGIQLTNHPLFKDYWSTVLQKKKQILERTNECHATYHETVTLVQRIEAKIKEL